MSHLCLDTSAYSHFRRGHQVCVDLVSSARQIIVPFVVVGELLSGFRQGSRAVENEKELNDFLSRPVVTQGIVDARVATQYADIVGELRRAGTPIPTNDIWIAATAAAVGASVLTYDRHFEHVRRVGCRTLQPES